MKMQLYTLAALGLSLMSVMGEAQVPTMVAISAPAEPTAIPLYGDKTPGQRSTEVWSSSAEIGLGIRNVTFPTLTPVFPKRGKANGSAVIVAPGGAFLLLSWEHEGLKIAKALASRGITAFVLKYRLNPTPVAESEVGPFVMDKIRQEAAGPMDGELLRDSKAPADAKAALALVRANAAKWKIDPTRVGMIGFSAGAMTARRVTLDNPVSDRPNFVGYIYGPQDAEPVPADAPPLFNAIAVDDQLFPTKGFAIAGAWLAAKRPVEVHGYQSGDHGFGAGRVGQTNRLVLDQFVAWMDMQGFLTPKKGR